MGRTLWGQHPHEMLINLYKDYPLEKPGHVHISKRYFNGDELYNSFLADCLGSDLASVIWMTKRAS